MKRITPEEVVAAYQKTGLKPNASTFLNPKGTCGCGIGALCLAETDRLENGVSVLDWGAEQFGHEYEGGFSDGFCLEGIALEYVPCRYAEGYADGRAAAEAVEKEFGPF